MLGITEGKKGVACLIPSLWIKLANNTNCI